MSNSKKIKVRYFASLREQANLLEEELQTTSNTALELYEELSEKYNFSLNSKNLKVSVNQKFAPMESALCEGDELVFIPPVAGG